jgi:DNA (cytosine-5)-methyltransferase 1
VGLEQAVLWRPTPRSNDAEKRGEFDLDNPRNGLAAAAAKKFPTPTARDHFPAHTPEYVAEKRAEGHGMSNLNDFVAHSGETFPTPTCRDHKDGTATACANVPANGLLGRVIHQGVVKVPGSLNPTWVEWLMFWPLFWTDLREGVCTGEHLSWEIEPAGVPRVAVGVPARVHRLKAIGNGQVPLCAALAFRILFERMGTV